MSSNTIYVQVYVNKFFVKHIERNEEVTEKAPEAFTTTRLLIGDFLIAEKVLSKAMKTVGYNKWLSSKPTIVMHPMSMTDGGLSQVEDQILRELAVSVGARNSFVWVGEKLTNEEIISKCKST